MLVVDDHAVNRIILLQMLASWECRTGEASNAKDAIHELRAAADTGDPYRLALLDMCMPDEDGASLGRRIKADPVLEKTKLIMITSLGTNGNRENLANVASEGSLTKPVRRGHLHDLLASVVDGTVAPKEPAPQTTVMPKKIPSRGRILLAEDNITNQLVAVKIIERLGHSVDVAANGLETVAAVKGIPYNLILMDCQMPEMDGFEATRRIRSGDAGDDHRHIPIIAMTARAMQGDREACLEAGMDDYLSKPIDFVALAKAIDRWLSPAVDGSGSSNTAPGKATDNSIFDRAALSDRLMGDEDAIQEVLHVFLDDTPRRIATLRGLISEGDAVGAGDQAHAIKGAAASIGGEVLRKIAFEMEKAGRAKDMETLVTKMTELEKGFEQLRLVMRSGR